MVPKAVKESVDVKQGSKCEHPITYSEVEEVKTSVSTYYIKDTVLEDGSIARETAQASKPIFDDRIHTERTILSKWCGKCRKQLEILK